MTSLSVTALYDGSFAGWCATCARLIESGADTPLFWRATGREEEGCLFDCAPAQGEMKADESALGRFYAALEEAGGRLLVMDLLCLFLSESPDREVLMFQMVRVSLEKRRRGRHWHSHPDMRRTGALIQSVRHEAHCACGLIRFMELRDGTYYGRYAPKHDITPLVAGHFQRRMPRNPWVIHDVQRDYGIAWDCHALRWVDGFPDRPEALTSRDEARFQECWRTFFSHVTVPERLNPRLQRRFLPERFRKFLPELS